MDMYNNTLDENVDKIICGELHIDGMPFSDDSNVFSDLGADKVDLAALLLKLEETFHISIAQDDCDSISTVGDIHRIVIEAVRGRLQHSADM